MADVMLTEGHRRAVAAAAASTAGVFALRADGGLRQCCRRSGEQDRRCGAAKPSAMLDSG
jgi:hypothetical protein